MAGEANAAPPVDTAAIVKQVTEQVMAGLKPVVESVKNLGDQVQQISTQLKESSSTALKAEDVQKLISEQVGKDLAAHQATAEQKSLRQRFVDELSGKGVAPEIINAHLPEKGDEAAMKAAVDKAIARWNEIGPKAPDVGGAARNGGTPAGSTPPPAGVGSGLSPGVAKFAESIKIPEK